MSQRLRQHNSITNCNQKSNIVAINCDLEQWVLILEYRACYRKRQRFPSKNNRQGRGGWDVEVGVKQNQTHLSYCIPPRPSISKPTSGAIHWPVLRKEAREGRAQGVYQVAWVTWETLPESFSARQEIDCFARGFMILEVVSTLKILVQSDDLYRPKRHPKHSWQRPQPIAKVLTRTCPWW